MSLVLTDMLIAQWKYKAEAAYDVVQSQVGHPNLFGNRIHLYVVTVYVTFPRADIVWRFAGCAHRTFEFGCVLCTCSASASASCQLRCVDSFWSLCYNWQVV